MKQNTSASTQSKKPVTSPDVVKSDARGQFVRRRSGSNPTRNPDGLHSANPVVLSGNGDATLPVKNRGKK